MIIVIGIIIVASILAIVSYKLGEWSQQRRWNKIDQERYAVVSEIMEVERNPLLYHAKEALRRAGEKV